MLRNLQQQFPIGVQPIVKAWRLRGLQVLRFPFGVASTDLTLPGPCIARPSPEAPSSPFAGDTFLPDCDIRRQGDESGPDPTEVSSSEFLYPSAFETSQPSPCSQNRSLEFVSVEQACRSGVSTKRRRLREVSCFMRAAGFLVGSTLFLMGCSQAIDYTYSKRNFTNSTFEADLSACRRAQPDDAMVRDCMKTKGYKINPDLR
jgi:hypothetical protein